MRLLNCLCIIVARTHNRLHVPSLKVVSMAVVVLGFYETAADGFSAGWLTSLFFSHRANRATPYGGRVDECCQHIRLLRFLSLSPEGGRYWDLLSYRNPAAPPGWDILRRGLPGGRTRGGAGLLGRCFRFGGGRRPLGLLAAASGVAPFHRWKCHCSSGS